MQIDRPISIAITLFVILLMVFFLVMPEYNTFEALQVSLAEKTAEYTAEFAYYNAISGTYQDLQAHKNELAKIDDALPQTPSIGQLVYSLQEIAVENSLSIKSLSVAKSSDSNSNGSQNGSNNIKNISFSMDVSGDYPSMESFLIALEKSDRIFEVTRISFGSSGQAVPGANQSQAQGNSFNLQIKTHSY